MLNVRSLEVSDLFLSLEKVEGLNNSPSKSLSVFPALGLSKTPHGAGLVMVFFFFPSSHGLGSNVRARQRHQVLYEVRGNRFEGWDKGKVEADARPRTVEVPGLALA